MSIKLTNGNVTMYRVPGFWKVFYTEATEILLKVPDAGKTVNGYDRWLME